jgi:hypothetical protein
MKNFYLFLYNRTVKIKIMKKYIICGMLLFYCIGSRGQELKFGVFVEPQLSWLTPDAKNIDRDGFRIGINGGMIMDKYFAKNYAFTTGVSISNIGGNLFYEDSLTIKTAEAEQLMTPRTTVDYRLQYVSVPLGLKFKTSQIGYFTFFAQLGFTPQITIRARADASRNQLDRENIIDEVNLLNLSYFFGGGIGYSLGGNTELIGGILFNNGFIDVLKSKNSRDTLSFLSLRFGIMF